MGGGRQTECKKGELSHELQNGLSLLQQEKWPATWSARTELRRDHTSFRPKRSTENRRDEDAEGQEVPAATAGTSPAPHEALTWVVASLLLLKGRDESGTCLAELNRAAGLRLALSETEHEQH